MKGAVLLMLLALVGIVIFIYFSSGNAINVINNNNADDVDTSGTAVNNSSADAATSKEAPPDATASLPPVIVTDMNPGGKAVYVKRNLQFDSVEVKLSRFTSVGGKGGSGSDSVSKYMATMVSDSVYTTQPELVQDGYILVAMAHSPFEQLTIRIATTPPIDVVVNPQSEMKFETS